MEGGFVEKPLLGESSTAGDPNTAKIAGGGGGREWLPSSITPAVILSTLVAVCGSFTYGCALNYTSPTQAAIMEDLQLSVAAYSIFGSVMTFGGMMGALFSGRIVDISGCKFTMWLSQVLCTIGWLLIIFANSAWWLYLGRFSIGYGVGLITYVVPIYIAEITPKEYRGGFVFTTMVVVNCGSSAIDLGNNISWRILAVISLIPGILQLMGLFFVPESPRWLAKVGRWEEFEASLQLLRGKETDIYKEKQEIKKIMDEYRENTDVKVTDLFEKKYTYSLIVGVGLMVFQQLGGLPGVVYYATAIIDRAGFPTSTGNIIISFILVPAAVVGMFLMDFSGRRPILMVSAGGMCLCSFLIGISFVLQGHNLLRHLTPIVIVLGITLYIGSFSIGLGGVPWIIMSEIFPTRVKATAGSLITLVSWSASFLVTYTFNFMLQWSPAGTFFIFSGICGASVVFTWKLVPETKGRTLEEIQASMVVTELE